MPQPYNYMLNLPDPTQSVMGGLMQGMQLRNMMLQEQQAAAQAQQQQAMQEELGALARAPTSDAIAKMALKYPQLADKFKAANEMLSEEQKQARVSEMTQVHMALMNDQPEVAKKVLGEYAASYRNSGREQDAKALEQFAAQIDQNKQGALTSSGLMLASALGPDKYVENLTGLSEARRKSDADDAFKTLMSGAETPEQVFERIPQLAQLGDAGLKMATDLLAQQRLRDEFKLKKDEASAKQEEQDLEVTRSFGLINAMFKKPGGGDGGGFRMVKTGGGQQIEVDEKAWSDAKGVPQFDKKKAQALGLDEPTMTAIQGVMAADPKQGAKMLSQVVMARVKQQLAPQKEDKITAEVRAYERMTPAQRAIYDKLQKGKATNVNVDVGVEKTDKTGGEERGKLLDKWYDDVTTGKQQLRDLDRYASLVDKSITGPLANARLTVDQVASSLGFKGSEAAANTRELIQGMSELTLQSRGMLKGQGAITEGETKLLERARSGDITMTGGELKRLFGVLKRGTEARYKRSEGLLRNTAKKGSEVAKMYAEELDADAANNPTGAPNPPKPAMSVDDAMKKYGK